MSFELGLEAWPQFTIRRLSQNLAMARDRDRAMVWDSIWEMAREMAGEIYRETVRGLIPDVKMVRSLNYYETVYLQQVLTKLELELEERPEDDDRELLKYISEFILFLQDIVCLLGEALRFILLGGVSTEFGVRKRPKCTTMPWDIWPSLVVLWGVCWMFYTPMSPRDQFLFQHNFEDDQFPVFGQDPWSITVPTSNQPLLGDFPFQDQIGAFDASDFSNLDLFGQTDFHAQASQPNLDNSGSFEALSAQPIRSVSEVNPDISEQAWHQNMTASMTSAPATSHLSGPSQTAMPGIGTSPNTPDPQVQASRASSNPVEGPKSPLCNAEGKFICTVFGCDSGKTFNKRSDWQTHTNKHTRPFRCPVEGCTSRSATRGVLKRHLERVHKQSSSEAATISRRSESISVSAHVDGTIAPLGAEGQSVPALDKGRGMSKRSLAPNNNAKESAETLQTEKIPKKVRLMEDDAVPGSASSECDESLVAENQRLRKELELSQKKLEWQQEVWERERGMYLGIMSGRKA